MTSQRSWSMASCGRAPISKVRRGMVGCLRGWWLPPLCAQPDTLDRVRDGPVGAGLAADDVEEAFGGLADGGRGGLRIGLAFYPVAADPLGVISVIAQDVGGALGGEAPTFGVEE